MIVFTEEMLRNKEQLHSLIESYSKDLDELIKFKETLESQPNVRFTNEIYFRYFELHKDRHDVKIVFSDRTVQLMLSLVNEAITMFGEILNELQNNFQNIEEYES